jgi:fructoselysine 6-kinase
VTTIRVLGFGDNIVDRFLDRGIEYPGGNCVNVAVLAHRLGAEAGYLGVFGDDELGNFVRACVEESGVDTSLSSTRHGPNGLTEIETVDRDRRFLGWNGGGVTTSDPVRLDDSSLAYAAGFGVVHSSAYSAVESELPKLRTADTLVSFDFSSESEFRSDEYLARVCPWIDLALVSCGGLSQTEVWEQLRTFHEHGAPLVLGTLGREGAVLFDGNSYFHSRASAVEGEFVDTMGCGDAYLAAFVVELLRSGWRRSTRPSGSALHRSMKRASQFAAMQCSVEGAFGFGRAVSIVRAGSVE